MPTEERTRWDQKHAAEPADSAPSAFLLEIFSAGPWRIPPGRALDVATGKGRNALFLAGRGFVVEGIDISETALTEARRRAETQGLSVTFRQADLAEAALPEAAYDLILNFNFLERSLVPRMKKALKLGGHVIFETYLIDQRVLGHPRNPAYLLAHNELLELFPDFRVLFYREGKFSEGEKEAYRAALLAQKVR